MIRVLRAELVKVVRRRVLMITAAAVVVFAIGGAAIVLIRPNLPRPYSGQRPDR